MPAPLLWHSFPSFSISLRVSQLSLSYPSLNSSSSPSANSVYTRPSIPYLLSHSFNWHVHLFHLAILLLIPSNPKYSSTWNASSPKMPSSTNSYVPSHIPVVLQNHLSHNVTYFKSSPSLIYVCTLSDLNPRHVLHSFPPSCPNLPSLLPFQYPSQIIHLIASFSSFVLLLYLLCPVCLLHFFNLPLHPPPPSSRTLSLSLLTVSHLPPSLLWSSSLSSLFFSYM